MNSITDAAYLTGVQTPGSGGSGIWRGLWRAQLDGVDGVAVVRHAYPNPSLLQPRIASAATFYAADGTQTQLEYSQGNAQKATFSYQKGATSASLTFDFVDALEGATYSMASGSVSGYGAWYRCATPPASPSFDRASYLTTPTNPYAYLQSSTCGAPYSRLYVPAPPSSPSTGVHGCPLNLPYTCSGGTCRCGPIRLLPKSTALP